MSESKSWASDLSKVEYERLKAYEYSGRVNEVLIEAIDFWTDIGFIVVLYIFAQEDITINYQDPILGTLAGTAFTACDASQTRPDRNEPLFFDLFVAALFFFVINFVVRLIMIIVYIIKKDGTSRLKKWVVYLVGLIITVMSPHNGYFFVDWAFTRGTHTEDVIALTKSEISLEVFLVCLEDFPQFVIQVIFFANVAYGDIPIAFWLAIVITVFSLLVSLGSIIVNAFKLRRLYIEYPTGTSQAALAP